MSVKLITYDLNRPGQSYNELYESIKNLGAWWHYLDSTWLVDSSKTPDAVVESLKHHFDGNDGLLVIDVSGDSYQGLLTKEAWDWINKHL